MIDVAVIGGGQAGLAAAYHLARTGLRFEVQERHPRVGNSWRSRFQSLVLFSPRELSALPGLRLEGDPRGYPSKDEIADYLERYARAFAFPISTGEGVIRLEHRGDRFVVTTERSRTLDARAVIVATGAFQRSVVPPFAARLSPQVFQLTADRYRIPEAVPRGRVLVVGGGGTGRQLALELAGAREVSLAVGRSIPITPQIVLGRDVMWWFARLGLLTADKSTAAGRLARAHESFPGPHLRSSALRRRGVRILPRAVEASGNRITCADGTVAAVDAVIWAAGYRDDSSWLAIPGASAPDGRHLEDRGISPVPGLFHVGRSWQTSRASALLYGIGFEAGRMVERVVRFLGSRSVPQSKEGGPAASGASSRMAATTDVHWRKPTDAW